MRNRYLASVGALALAGVLIALAAVSTRGQNAAPKAAATKAAGPTLPKPGLAPKMPLGEPDLQGTWFVMESVPLERSAANANKQFLTEDEVAAADKAKTVDPG